MTDTEKITAIRRLIESTDFVLIEDTAKCLLSIINIIYNESNDKE